MTQAARSVLRDCEAALEEITRASGVWESDALDSQTFQRRWVAIIVLLRVVGHVLYKVDRHQSPEMARAINDAWDELKNTEPEPRIFWEFIDKERNNILKLYQFSLDTTEDLIAGTPYTLYLYSSENFVASIPNIVQKAIEWWTDYLDMIERKAASQAQ